jgi:hypothetical protein
MASKQVAITINFPPNRFFHSEGIYSLDGLASLIISYLKNDLNFTYFFLYFLNIY